MYSVLFCWAQVLLKSKLINERFFFKMVEMFGAGWPESNAIADASGPAVSDGLLAQHQSEAEYFNYDLDDLV
jgi:hypothetical protein